MAWDRFEVATRPIRSPLARRLLVVAAVVGALLVGSVIGLAVGVGSRFYGPAPAATAEPAAARSAASECPSRRWMNGVCEGTNPPAATPEPQPTTAPAPVAVATPAQAARWTREQCGWAENTLELDTKYDMENRPPSMSAADRAYLDQQARNWTMVDNLIRITVCDPDRPISTSPPAPPGSWVAAADGSPTITSAGCDWAQGLITTAEGTHEADIGKPPAWPGETQQQHDDWDRQWIAAYEALLGYFRVGCGAR